MTSTLTKTLGAAVAAALLLGTGATAGWAAATEAPPSGAAGYAPVGTSQLLTLVNRQRRAGGLAALTLDSRLAAIARTHTERMAADGVLRHNDELLSASSHTSLRCTTLGENVGWNYSVPAQHDAFMHSAGHRANVMARGFRVAGFAVVRGKDGRIWTTEDFGTPG
jgi:uncharacterized protein YkwD